ncbi:hypothetical protein EDF81_4461 [Enterobacter sp. BIGb0383]|uniref:phospholipase D-like domain-containing protein n=1 Tax=unclassified Enterobacter TaxID=2608935 RepID=UPI000F46C4E2|nr:MULTISPECIES: phospholipase D-like domain-containing protein [unclassified Enterobacter]ROP49449.1 hypothetical protein EDF81_4461 [Enterobacter sp. BIGb0383]ROS00675.1 hypothetical protein EC848_4367 [Enterobacter sp. BIGb0359]
MSNIKPSEQICTAVPGLTREIILTPQWIPEKGEYPLCRAAYAPLICGEHTFAVIAKAIESATKSIDIITWGFQASMYLTRGGQGPHKMVGELLEEAANRGVQVRLLVWFSGTAQNFAGPSFPGWGAWGSVAQRKGETIWNLSAKGNKLDYETAEQYEFDKKWHFRAGRYDIKGLRVLSRTMDMASLGYRLDELPYKVNRDSSLTRKMALEHGGTHHQKMILIDYEDPELAVGFVMGHNMLSQYWDTQKHPWQRGYSAAPDQGRDGYTGWQDISSCVYGEVLKHLNDNFVQAWDKAELDYQPLQLISLTETRASIKKDLFIPTAKRLAAIKNRLGDGAFNFTLTPVMGKICRTQPQYKAYDILKAYMESVNRTRHYIYIENQYFRFTELAEQILKRAKDLICAGVNPEEHGYLYLFVVTNSTTDPDVVTGGLRTWEMLDMLGRGDRMPDYTAMVHNQDPNNKDDQWEASKIDIQDIPGLKAHICTLVCPDSPQGSRLRTYVHSKLMMIDDIFLIQGSANINLRSMAFDSEIAIALQDTDQGNIVKKMRNELWGLHTNNGEGCTGDDFRGIYKEWNDLLAKNTAIWASLNGGELKASIINFIDNSISLEDKD